MQVALTPLSLRTGLNRMQGTKNTMIHVSMWNMLSSGTKMCESFSGAQIVRKHRKHDIPLQKLLVGGSFSISPDCVPSVENGGNSKALCSGHMMVIISKTYHHIWRLTRIV
ncbi:hypothetical protein VNO78_23619 [Psophocarpus tetragonolobus]|uniref:Uncharacterized protein n=1 Tax=Psophocarpus tetragonolobus TaxID=3891 RepID=A0AAN9S4G3_PSOTE